MVVTQQQRTMGRSVAVGLQGVASFSVEEKHHRRPIPHSRPGLLKEGRGAGGVFEFKEIFGSVSKFHNLILVKLEK